MIFLTVPTAGKRPQSLEKLIQDSGLPRDHVVLISTSPEAQLPQDCVVVHDTGPINIQRWWSTGIAEAVARGATAVAVSNDDVALNSQTLTLLHEHMQATGATIAAPARDDKRRGLHKGRLVPYSPVLWGSLWLIDPSHGLMPDTRYQWWYGDNDLDIRARKHHAGVVSVDVVFEHTNAGESTGESSKLQELAKRDRQLFESQYSRLIWMTDKWNALRRFFSSPSITPSHDPTKAG